MSRHHIMPPVIYTPPPPKKIETKKRRIGIGAPGAFDETAETHESGGSTSRRWSQTSSCNRTFLKSKAPIASHKVRKDGSAKPHCQCCCACRKRNKRAAYKSRVLLTTRV
jgi:hypothetical protein